jgi:antitoxin component of RelBE/YafQ-DinJ toxin-antitoxin module
MKRGHELRVRVTAEEKDAFEAAAAELGISLSDWVRLVCRQALKGK